MASERSPELAEVVRRALDAGLLDLRVALPGRIVSFDSATQRADVKPTVKRAFLDEEDERKLDQLPVIPGVPVVFPGAGGYRFTFPVKAGDQDGDLCLLVFADASLDRWLAGSGAEVDPEIDHSHALPDAVALLGLHTFGAPLSSFPTDHATAGKDDGVQIHFRGSTISIGDETNNDFLARAQKVVDELNKLKTHFDVWQAIITGAAINEPGNGAPSALQAALKIAILASPYPAPASVAASQAKGQ